MKRAEAGGRIEAGTSLFAHAWVRLLTTNLTGGALAFADPAVANYRARFCRIVGP